MSSSSNGKRGREFDKFLDSTGHLFCVVWSQNASRAEPLQDLGVSKLLEECLRSRVSKSLQDHCRKFAKEECLSAGIYPKETFYSEKLGTHRSSIPRDFT